MSGPIPLTREVRIVTAIHIPGLIDVSSQLVSVDIRSWEDRGYVEGRVYRHSEYMVGVSITGTGKLTVVVAKFTFKGQIYPGNLLFGILLLLQRQHKEREFTSQYILSFSYHTNSNSHT